MIKRSRIVIDVETDFKTITGKDFGDGDEEDDFTKEVEDSFHDKVFEKFEKLATEDDDFEGDILMAMADDGNLPKDVGEFNKLGAITIRIGEERVDRLTESQQYKLAEVIGKWYFDWKDKIVHNDIPHSFGFAKEDLKKRIEEVR